MTDTQAIDYSLIKWKYAKDTGCNHDKLKEWLYYNHNKIYIFAAACGLCEKYIDCYYNSCSNCLLYKKWEMNCENHKSLYNKWFNAKTKKTRIKYATLIYKDLLEIKESL